MSFLWVEDRFYVFFFNTRDRGGKKKEIRFIEEVMTKTQKRWSQLRLSTRDKWRGELNSCGGREKKRFEGKESQLSFLLLLLLLLKKNFLQKTKNVLRNPKGGRTGDDCVIIVIQDRVGMRFCFVFVCLFFLFVFFFVASRVPVMSLRFWILLFFMSFMTWMGIAEMAGGITSVHFFCWKRKVLIFASYRVFTEFS